MDVFRKYFAEANGSFVISSHRPPLPPRPRQYFRCHPIFDRLVAWLPRPGLTGGIQFLSYPEWRSHARSCPSIRPGIGYARAIRVFAQSQRPRGGIDWRDACGRTTGGISRNHENRGVYPGDEGNRLRRPVSSLHAPLVRNRSAFNPVGFLESVFSAGARRCSRGIRAVSATWNAPQSCMGWLVWNSAAISPGRLGHIHNVCAHGCRPEHRISTALGLYRLIGRRRCMFLHKPRL
jgi:hypothetical protein